MMMPNKWVFGFILIVIVLLSHASFAHTIYNPSGNVPGRTTTVLKTGPCGGVLKTSSPKTLAAGTSVRVDWLETIQHPGRFELYLLDANDANPQPIASIPDDQNGTTDLPHSFSKMIQLPAGFTCTNCTLQLIQVMTEVPDAPTFYYSCADVTIQAGASTSPSPVPTAGATGPSPACTDH